MKQYINLNRNPFCPDWLTVVKHIKGDKNFEWSPDKVELFLTDKQREKYQTGTELQNELENKPVFNANLLDWLLEHPDQIPEEWKNYYGVYFWGTIYRSSCGSLCVRFLYLHGSKWYGDYYLLDDDFDDHDPAAVSASLLSHSLLCPHCNKEIKLNI